MTTIHLKINKNLNGLCRPRSKELNGFFGYLNLRIHTQVLDQPSLFFWHPKDGHQLGELQTEVIGIECRCLLLHEE